MGMSFALNAGVVIMGLPANFLATVSGAPRTFCAEGCPGVVRTCRARRAGGANGRSVRLCAAVCSR
eukprot:2008752-Pyramimonas_sp.AAC.1